MYTGQPCISEPSLRPHQTPHISFNQPICSRMGTNRHHPPALTQDALRASKARCLAPRRSARSPGHQYDNVDQLHDSWKNCMTSVPVARTIITFFTIPATGTRRRLLALTCRETSSGVRLLVCQEHK